MPSDRFALRLSGLILVVGIGVLGALGVELWPWTLAVLALSVLPVGVARGGWIGGLIPALWLVGLVIAIALDEFAAGLIVLLALTVILRGTVRGMAAAQASAPRKRSIRKRH